MITLYLARRDERNAKQHEEAPEILESVDVLAPGLDTESVISKK